MGSLYEAQINFNRWGYKQVAPDGASLAAMEFY